MLSITEKNILKSYLLLYLQDHHNIDITHNFKCLSPEHSDDHPSMSYSSRYNVCHCFACGKTYDIFSLVAEDYNIDQKDFKSILKKIKELYPDSYEEKIKIVKNSIEENFAPVDYSEYFEKCHNDVNKTDYLSKRGISDESIGKYNIGYDIDKKMAIFPINRNCYFSRSTYSDFKQNPKGTLYCWGEEKLNNSTEQDFVIITESIIDAISLEQVCDKYPVMALNGVCNYPRFIKALTDSNYKGNVIIATDNDSRGQQYGVEIQKKLKELGVAYAIYYPFTHDYKDINEACLNNIQEIKNSYNYLSTVLSQIQKNHYKSSSEDYEL